MATKKTAATHCLRTRGLELRQIPSQRKVNGHPNDLSKLLSNYSLIQIRSDDINQCYDEFYPIHQAALHDIKFLELLIQCGAETAVKTSTQQMTALHVVLLQVIKIPNMLITIEIITVN